MLRFGTLGVAKITPRALVNPCIDEPRADVVAIAARDRARAEVYARHAHIRHVLDDYQAVIDHPNVNAIYNPLPITAHKEWTLKALAAGKPVLCEKSFAANAEEAQAMADAAAAAHLVHITGEEPAEVAARAEVGPPHVDLLVEAQVTFPSGVRGFTSGDMRPEAQFRADIEVVGSAGTLNVVDPIVPQNGHALQLTVDGRSSSETLDRRPTYGYQLDAFIAAVEEGAPMFTGPEDAVAQMRLIDRCYEAAGLPVRGLVDP